MGTGCAIVAIPSKRDRVWQISSEKIPHMTLLYLGELPSSFDRIRVAKYVGHVASMSRTFGMTIDERGVLGDDKADVLFFNKDKWAVEAPKSIRSFLLSDQEILQQYNSIEQYPQWTPHLTLGYPTAPAKKLDDPDREPYYVEFDKLAIWYGDFEGPTFDLKDSNYAEEVMMSDNVESFLEHFGVKGMKWGVRKDKGHEGEKATNKKIAKLDAKFEKGSHQKYLAVYNTMAAKMNNGEIYRINNDKRFKGKDLSDPNSPLAKAYYAEYSKTATRILNEASSNILGTNASGTKEWRWDYDVQNDAMPSARIVDIEEVKHDDSSTSVKITWSSNGHILKIELGPDAMEQTDEDELDDFLQHFGVKGMRWGVRKDPVDVTVDSRRPGRRLKASGGQNQPAHEDAIRSAAVRQRAKASTLDSVSTKDLQELVNRMNLEQQYAKLSANNTSPGRKIVNEILTNTIKQQAARYVNAQATSFMDSKLKK